MYMFLLIFYLDNVALCAQEIQKDLKMFLWYFRLKLFDTRRISLKLVSHPEEAATCRKASRLLGSHIIHWLLQIHVKANSPSKWWFVQESALLLAPHNQLAWSNMQILLLDKMHRGRTKSLWPNLPTVSNKQMASNQYLAVSSPL